MQRSKALWIILSFLPAILIIIILFINANITYSSIPGVKGGILDLSGRDMKTGVFNISGQWEFYWDRLLDDTEIESSKEKFVLIDTPGIWNDFKIDGKILPGFGKATYRAHVVNAPASERLAVRIQNMASAYRLYIDDNLIAENGDFGDKADARVSKYRPQFSEFTCGKDNFDLILQVSNDAYAVGGMWEPIMFGLFEPVSSVNNAVKVFGYFSIGSIIVMCLYFAIMFVINRKEKELLILCIIGLLVVIHLLELGDVIITYILPDMPISGFGWIDYLTQVWIQFFLLYFVYVVYSSLVNKWYVRILLIYTICISAFVLLFPFEIVAGTYMIMNFIILFIIAVIVVYMVMAVLEGRTGARSLLAAMVFILFFLLYEQFVNDLSIIFFLINGWSLDFTILFVVQCTIIARRYYEAQRIELGLLKSQIRPHFVHNALASIISISRKDSERSRELLIDFSNYLRGCYDNEDNNDLIPIDQELDFVRAYVALEQARFGEKLNVEYRIEMSKILIPPLILQPLVENAFIHGLREKEEGGTVVVYVAGLTEKTVRIGVRDDGVGMNIRPKKSQDRHGIGIGNINRRLSKLYHTQLQYLVPEGGGCEVYMKIPYKEADRVEGDAS